MVGAVISKEMQTSDGQTSDFPPSTVILSVSEGSRYVETVTQWLVNTRRREDNRQFSAYRCPQKDVRLSDGRRLYSRRQEGSGALRRQGSRCCRGKPLSCWFGPKSAPPSGLVQRGVIKYHCVGGMRRLRSQYKCCLRQQPPLVAGATTFPPQAVGQ